MAISTFGASVGVARTLLAIQSPGPPPSCETPLSVPLRDEGALQAVRQWRFEPTVVEGRPVPVPMVVAVNFTLSQ